MFWGGRGSRNDKVDFRREVLCGKTWPVLKEERAEIRSSKPVVTPLRFHQARSTLQKAGKVFIPSRGSLKGVAHLINLLTALVE